MLHILETIFHETTHAIDRKKKKEKPLDYDVYKMLMDDFLRSYSTNDHYDYYHQNYLFIFSEINARANEVTKTFDYLQSLGLTEQEIIEMDMIEKRDRYIDCRRRAEDVQWIESAKGQIKYNSNNQLKDIRLIIQDLINQRPELVHMLPPQIAEMEFENGRLMTNTEMIYKFSQNDQEYRDERYKLIHRILLDRISLINPNFIIAELEKLNSTESDNRDFKSLRNYNIRDNLLSALFFYKKMSHISKYAEAYTKASDLLTQFAMAHPDLEISQVIQDRIANIQDESKLFSRLPVIMPKLVEMAEEEYKREKGEQGEEESQPAIDNEEEQCFQEIDNTVTPQERKRATDAIKEIKRERPEEEQFQKVDETNIEQ